MFPDLIPADAAAGGAPPGPRTTTPTLFSPTGRAERRFWEFFTVQIRNPNTRLAYLAAVRRFAEWCERRGVALDQVEPMVVAAYIEQLSGALAPASVKQHLAALRMLFDWLVVGHRRGPARTPVPELQAGAARCAPGSGDVALECAEDA